MAPLNNRLLVGGRSLAEDHLNAEGRQPKVQSRRVGRFRGRIEKDALVIELKLSRQAPVREGQTEGCLVVFHGGVALGAFESTAIAQKPDPTTSVDQVDQRDRAQIGHLLIALGIELPALVGHRHREPRRLGQGAVAVIVARQCLGFEQTSDRGRARQPGPSRLLAQLAMDRFGAPAGMVVSPLQHRLANRGSEGAHRPSEGPSHGRGQGGTPAAVEAASPFAHGVDRTVHLGGNVAIVESGLDVVNDAAAFFERSSTGHGSRVFGEANASGTVV